MKVGIRTPSIKKSVKARTTGRINRAVKRSVNPLYGKKGMGYINNPKKAVYNKVYNKTTVGVFDGHQVAAPRSNSPNAELPPAKKSKGAFIFMRVLSIILVLLGLVLCIVTPVFGVFAIVLGIVFFFLAKSLHKPE